MQKLMTEARKIVEKHGNGSFEAGLNNLRNGATGDGEGSSIRIEKPHHLPLNIDWMGTLDGFDVLGVSHTYVQNGDVMSDPLMTFQVDLDGGFYPISFENSGVGLYQVCKFKDDQGRMMINPKLQQELRSFSRTWNKNLREQGFLKAMAA